MSDTRTFHVVLEMSLDEEDAKRILVPDEDEPLLFRDAPCKIYGYQVVSPPEPPRGSTVYAGGNSYVRGSDGWWYRTSDIPNVTNVVDWNYLTTFEDLFISFQAAPLLPSSSKINPLEDPS